MQIYKQKGKKKNWVIFTNSNTAQMEEKKPF